MTLSILDVLVIAGYFLLVFFLGFYVARRKKVGEISSSKDESAIDFLLAGRKLTLPMFVGTLVATWYGNILGMGEFVFTNGFSAWLCFSFPYYISAGIFAALFAKKIRKSQFKSIPEQIASRFGAKAAWIAALIVLIITIPAAYYLMIGTMIQMFFGWELWAAVLFGAVVSLAYLFTGGFKADVITNVAQFVLMYLGFGVLLFFCISHFGSVESMWFALPAKHKELTGGLSWQYILSWFIISMQTFVDPGFHQRCAAAKTPETAQRGIFISVLCWLVFDTMTLLTGLYAVAYITPENAIMAYPVLGEQILPVVWKGLFVVSLLSVIMSTLDSYSFLSAATIGNDILQPLMKKIKMRIPEISTLTRIGLALTGMGSILLAVAVPSAVGLIYKTSSIAVPGLLAPLIASYYGKFKISNKGVILMMVIPSGIAALWTLGAYFFIIWNISQFSIFANVEPMLIGICTSILCSIIFIKR